MKQKNITFEYDSEVDAAYLTLARGRVRLSKEIKPGVIIDYGTRDQILGVEILRFAKRFLPHVSSKAPPNHRSKPLRKSA